MNDKPSTNEKGFKSVISRFLKMPSFLDSGINQVAETLHILTLAIFLIALGIILITPFVFSNLIIGLAITGSLMVLISLVYVLNQWGKVKLAAHIFIYSIWIIDTIIILISGGYSSPYLPSYVTISVMGGLILGVLAAYQFAGISLISLLLFFFLGNTGMIPDPIIIFKPLSMVIIHFVNIVVPAWTLIIVIQKYDTTLNELTKKELSLSETNQKLNLEVSARREAETLQSENEERFKSAWMDSPHPTMLHADDNEVILINDAWKEKIGSSTRQLTNAEDWIDHSFRENASSVKDEINQLLGSTSQQRESHYSLYDEYGNKLTWILHWTQLSKLPDGRNLILTTATDITSLQYVETALRESEENLSKFSILTNDGIWDWDLQTNQVTFDPRYYTMAGYEVNEFPHLLDEFRIRVHPDDVDKVFDDADNYINGKVAQFNIEFRFLRKDGSWLWVLGRGKITEQDENGDALRFVGTHTDISSQKAVEEKLSQYQHHLEDIVKDRTHRLNERISEVERLNAALTNILDDYQTANEKLASMSSSLTDTYRELESFTYSVSNDLRVPLDKILESSDILLKEPLAVQDENTTAQIEQVRDNARLLNNLINHLIKVSTISRQTMQPQTIDPVLMIDEIINSYSDQITGRNLNFEIKDLPHFRADKIYIHQALDIMISNAIKFTKNEQKPKITIGYQPGESSSRVILYIKDNGVGFNMEDKEKVFDTFMRLHDQDEFQGSGVGLALAKKIINLHGGEIWVEAAEKEGATFYFDLERAL